MSAVCTDELWDRALALNFWLWVIMFASKQPTTNVEESSSTSRATRTQAQSDMGKSACAPIPNVPNVVHGCWLGCSTCYPNAWLEKSCVDFSTSLLESVSSVRPL
eukprot:3597253-Amphidinium_carterae.1